MLDTLLISLIIISVIILMCAIRNIYAIKYSINSIKNRKTLNFIRLNIILSLIFILGYIFFAVLLKYEIQYGGKDLTSLIATVLFCFTAVFLFIASIVTREMGKLLYTLDKLRKLDPLTNIYNRAYIEKQIANEFDRSKRYNRIASLLMIDINKFKIINDSYGHQLGDKVILDLVDTINNELRDIDILGRYGGDEFIIIMPETNSSDAKNFIERLNNIISSKVINYLNKEVTYDISVGISEIKAEYNGYEHWLRVTDINLYQIKNQGNSGSLKIVS